MIDELGGLLFVFDGTGLTISATGTTGALRPSGAFNFRFRPRLLRRSGSRYRPGCRVERPGLFEQRADQVGPVGRCDGTHGGFRPRDRVERCLDGRRIAGGQFNGHAGRLAGFGGQRMRRGDRCRAREVEDQANPALHGFRVIASDKSQPPDRGAVRDQRQAVEIDRDAAARYALGGCMKCCWPAQADHDLGFGRVGGQLHGKQLCAAAGIGWRRRYRHQDQAQGKRTPISDHGLAHSNLGEGVRSLSAHYAGSIRFDLILSL